MSQRLLLCVCVILFWSAPLAPAEPVVYKRVGDRELKLFVDKPAGWKAGADLPAVVFYFGGGWVGGSPTQFEPQSSYLSTRGVVGVRVEYRVLAKGEAELPTVCVQDAKSAMRYVRAHAKELGIDAKRIAAAGGSAGGHLAAATALLPGLDDPQDDLAVSCVPDALILFNPVLNNGPGQWGNGRVKERFKEFSPAHNVKAKAPPAVVFLGDQDRLIPVQVMRDFAASMKAVGARCDLHVYPGAGHGFFNKRPSKEDRWFVATLVEADRFLASLGWVKGEPTLREAGPATSEPK